MTETRESPGADLQPRLDEKNAALTERLALIEKQGAAELARFRPAPKVAKGPKVK